MIMNRIVTSYTDDGSPRAQSTPARLFREELEITAEIPRHLPAGRAMYARRIIGE
jgi:hypothetical protein